MIATWHASRLDKGLSNSFGIAVTVGVHVAIAAVLLFKQDAPMPTAPAPISTRIISEDDQPERPEPIRPEPVLERPQMFVPQPEVVIAAEAPPISAPVAVTSSPPPQSTQPQRVVESLPRFDADYLNNPAPAYPALSRRLREQGTVLLRVYVLPTGLPDAIELKQSSGSARLDESALAAVRRWKFAPAQSAGRSIGAWVVVPVAFSLSA